MKANFIAIVPNEQSVAKVLQTPKTGRASKLTAEYWRERVFKRKGADGRLAVNFCVALQHGGTRKFVYLPTGDKIKAAGMAAGIYSAIRSKGWDAALAEFDPERAKVHCVHTVGDVCASIMAAGLRTRTAANYCHGLRWWAARALDMKARRADFGPTGSRAYRAKAEALHLDDLRPEHLRGVIARVIAEAGGDAIKERSAKISVSSFLRNAKAGLKAAEKLGMKLPTPRPFEGVQAPTGAKAPVYRSNIDAAELLGKARLDLRETNHAAYLAILLALGAGLRRGEIGNLTWQHVNARTSKIDVSAGGSWTPKTLESEAAVYVDPSMIAELEHFRAGHDDHVTTPAGLEAAIFWLRGQGIRDDKPLHTLRKEFGSIVAQSADLFTASKQLRHSSLAVTAAYYVENRKQVAPNIGKMLALKPKGK
ncbi:MAG: tyrosine-type recombinase/integrase [Verrucomicrobiota bacterium]